jgi:CrcB protein
MERTAPLLVAAGGAVGALARHAVSLAVPGAAGTLAVNVAGSLLLGAFVARSTDARLHLLVGTGALSSFTTYSTFAVETTALGVAGGAGNVAATYALCLAAAAVGLRAGGRA